MIAFTIGAVAIVVIMVLFASGAHDLPLALNLTAMLAPLGLGVALYGVYREARAASREAAAAVPEPAEHAGTTGVGRHGDGRHQRRADRPMTGGTSVDRTAR